MLKKQIVECYLTKWASSKYTNKISMKNATCKQVSWKRW